MLSLYEWILLVQSFCLLISVVMLVRAHREALGLVSEMTNALCLARSLAAKLTDVPLDGKALDGKSTLNTKEVVK